MEDYPMWLWFSKNSKIKFLNEYFITYRVIENSISNQVNIDKQLKFQKNVWEIRNFYKKVNGDAESMFDEKMVRFEIILNRCFLDFHYEEFNTLKRMYKELNINNQKTKLKLLILNNKLLRNIYNKFK